MQKYQSLFEINSEWLCEANVMKIQQSLLARGREYSAKGFLWLPLRTTQYGNKQNDVLGEWRLQALH